MIKQNHSQAIKALESLLQDQADSSRAAREKAYMKNHFSFFGVARPILRKLYKKWIDEYPIENESDFTLIIKTLWDLEIREYHYIAIEIARKHQGYYKLETLMLFEEMIRKHSWWDSIDEIAAHLVGPLLIMYPALIDKMDGWIEDQDFWIRRTAILYQIQYKDQVDEKRLFRYCEKCMGEKEFFIRKVIGWSLREYGKYRPESVRKFTEKYRDKLSGLSYREATKYL